jgi:hypothetical protein
MLMSPAAAVANVGVNYGLIIGRAADIGIGVAGQVVPAVNELDWMLLDLAIGTFSGATADATFPWSVDLRAKRKMQELGQRYFLSVTNPSGVAALTYELFARTLIALP